MIEMKVVRCTDTVPDQKEIFKIQIWFVTGSARRVTCKDRVNMPYTNAVLYETLRKANITNTSLPHTLDKDVLVDGEVCICFSFSHRESFNICVKHYRRVTIVRM